MGNDNGVVVLASFRPKDGQSDDVEKILQGMVAPSRAEAGCERYDLYRGPSGFHLFERYRDGAALDAHRDTDHYRAYRAAIADHLAEDIGVLKLEPIDVAT